MAWDLRRALLKKEEFESARLMNFEFRQRARATRLLARELGLGDEALVREIAVRGEADLLEKVIDVQEDGCALPLSGVSKAWRAIDAPHWGARPGALASLGACAAAERRAGGLCGLVDVSGIRAVLRNDKHPPGGREQANFIATAGSSRWACWATAGSTVACSLRDRHVQSAC